MTMNSTKSAPNCPVCGAAGKPLLALPAQPIYQHPVPEEAQAPEPHRVDLAWASCQACAHAWQPDFDAELLTNIYRSYYYTPAPDGLGVQFRNDFVATLVHFGLAGPRRVVLEIGASAGDVLKDIAGRSGAEIVYAFEPNVENASVARRCGLDVRERFFSADVVGENLEAVDLLYARHVIEHIFDFDSFFAGVNVVCAPSADLVLETPSLDFHAQRVSTDPFHIEHVHVFSLRSLQHLASRHGWGLHRATVTPAGNLISAFRRELLSPDSAAPQLEDLQRTIVERQAVLRQLFAPRYIGFWGAGTSGIALANIIGREPDVWTDGNAGKVGKKFVGLSSRIVSPEDALARLCSSLSASPLLVITSAFIGEILPRVRQLGWRGEVYDYEGRRL